MEDFAKVATVPESQDSGPPSVICTGLWRMGTASMAVAFDDLGIRPHHALDMTDWPEQWVHFEAAADATWPGKTPPPRGPFTRDEWDAIYAKFGAVTEIGAAFSEQLIAAYPDAKVVVVRRDFDKWWPSFKTGVVDPVFSLTGTAMLYLVLPILGNRGLAAMRKIILGFFGARSVADIEKNARDVYDRHFERINELVPPERRLEYTLGQGWDPLCAFLGVEVPNKEFPFINEGEALKKRQAQEVVKFRNQAWQKVTSSLPGFS